MQQRTTQKFIVKLFPEIMVKGTSAKRQMIDRLYQNLRTLLHAIDETIAIKKFSDKIEIVVGNTLAEKVRDLLKRTPGIEQILEAIQFDEMDTLDRIKRTVAETMRERLAGKSFVVRAKRTGTHPFNSMQIERVVGGYTLAHTDAKKVDLHTPDVVVYLELVNRQLNIVTARYKGIGGFPLGTQGEALSLMSGGFDSTVASYLSMRRGIVTHFLFFNLGGAAHEIGVKQVAWYLRNRYGASHRVRFVTVPFEEVVTEIFRSVSPSYMGVMLKRLMLHAAEKIADDMGIDALITGESVAQVSSQTLRNLALIDEATHKLVLRPLAMTDKPDIIAMAEQIGTKYFAESMPEYCGVISKNPVTHGSYKRMRQEASRFDYGVLDKAVENAETIYVDEIVENIAENTSVEVVHTPDPNDDVVIDIRPGEACVDTPCETLKIPFYDLKTAFEKLPKEKHYLLYCDKGIMSRLHAQYLNDAHGANVKVYRPE